MEQASYVFANETEALEAAMSAVKFLAEADATQRPASVTANLLRTLEKLDAAEAVARGKLLWYFDLERGFEGEGYGGTRNFIRYDTRVTLGQAKAHTALMRFREVHPPFQQALLDGHLSLSVAKRVGQLTRKIDDDAARTWVDEHIVAAAMIGASEHDLMIIAGAAVERLAPPDPDKPFKDRYLTLETTFEGAGVLRGDLTPECAAMLGAVLARLALKQGTADGRSQMERNHDALEEMCRRLLGADLLPKVNGHAVMANVHIWLGDLLNLDDGSVLQQMWTERYAAKWAAKRISAAEGMGDGGAWIAGPAARRVACDAVLFPIVVGDPDLDAVDDLLRIAVDLDGYLHGHSDDIPAAAGADDAAGTDRMGEAVRDPERAGAVIALMEDLIDAAVRMMSGEPGLAAFLRRGLLGPLGLGGPSLPLDVGDTSTVPWWIRQAVHIRDGRCQAPTGCDQPGRDCHGHHIVPREEHGPTSLRNIGDYCKFHHLTWIHKWGYQLRLRGDGTWEAVSPDGTKTFKTTGRPPPPRPG